MGNRKNLVASDSQGVTIPNWIAGWKSSDSVSPDRAVAIRGDRPMNDQNQPEKKPLPPTVSLTPASDGATPPPGGKPASGATEPSFPEIPGYQVLEKLDEGGMGEVLLVHEPHLNRRLALKVLRLEYRQQADMIRRFVEEAQIAGQLQHPGIAPIHELGTLPDGRPFFTMKLIQGRTLADLLRARPAPQEDVPRFLAIFEQMCQALAFAHSHRVIHRDLKPANVMVGAFGEVQLMDWGLGKVLPADATDEQDNEESFASAIQTISSLAGVPASRAGTIMGSRPYIPPEQARGESQRVGTASDVFGLGAILCEILTGLPPFTGANKEIQSLAQDGNLQPAFERLDRCGQDAELVNLAKRCLAPNPGDRLADAGQVAAAVRSYLDGVQERLRRAELQRAQAEVKGAEERKRRRVVVGLAAAILLLVLGVSGVAFWYLQNKALAEQDMRQ